MVDPIATLHCKVLAMRQESKARQMYYADAGQGETYHEYVMETRVGAELDRVLALFKEVEDDTKAPAE